MPDKNTNIPNPLNKKNPKGFKIGIEWLYAGIAIVLIAMWFMNPTTPVKNVDYSQLQQFMENQQIESIVVVRNKGIVRAFVKPDAIKSVFGDEAEKFEKIEKPFVEVKIPSVDAFNEFVREIGFTGVSYEDSKDFMEGLVWYLPFIIIIGFWIFIMRRMSG